MRYRADLDGLRGIAILLVIASHFGVPFMPAGGWVGVEVFFVLSGFLITGVLVAELERTGGIRLGVFYVRRFRRLAPALLVMVATVAAADALVTHGHKEIPALAAATYWSNWLRIAGVDLETLHHTWSLGVEEQFYLVWPVLLGIAWLLRGRRGALRLAVAIAAAALVWRVGLWLSTGDLVRTFEGTDVRADALMAGAALALVGARARTFPRGTMAAGLGVLLLVSTLRPGVTDGTLMQVVGMPAVIAVTLLLIVARSAALGWRPLAAVGRLSYSLYLWHYPVMYAASGLFGETPWWTIPLSVALAGLSYRFVEQPFRVRASVAAAPAGREVLSGSPATSGAEARARA